MAQLAGYPEGEEPLKGKLAPARPQLQPAPRTNNTGLPDKLKAGIESRSGMVLDHVRVHYNSSQPAQLNALAYAQGTDIHLAPGQERHLPHEAWHVVQQAQGRVRPTMQLKDGVPGNDDAELEREADEMGTAAAAGPRTSNRLETAPLASTKPLSTIQCYRTTEDSRFHVSENNKFAVATTPYPNTIYVGTEESPPQNLLGLRWEQAEDKQIEASIFTSWVADIREHDEKHGPGTEAFCGKFARELTGALPAEPQSKADVGGVLYDDKTTPHANQQGWANHYAAVVKVDGGDHATFETAVGIQEVWVGIYGRERGKTFSYKTQEANIERMLTLPDFVIPARTRVEQTFWQWIFGLPGREVVKEAEVRTPTRISQEQADQWKAEMVAWRKFGEVPTSPYMKKIVEKFEDELKSLAS
ncbi:MAG: DUF4157 domain-containing protein [Synechococcaceae cyanobacterium]|nr:DUF4157 domain-containing protein [Synechococcaceae cyanobacterium]